MTKPTSKNASVIDNSDTGTSKDASVTDDSDIENKGGAIINKPGTRNLYVLFTYLGERVEKTTGKRDTPDNRKEVRRWLNIVIEKRDNGTLRFAEAFPDAPLHEKLKFSKLEGREHSPEPSEVLIGDYIKVWKTSYMLECASDTKQGDYLAILKAWIEPHFESITFYDLTGPAVKTFMDSFKCKIGNNKGEMLSRSRAQNIMTVLRAVFDDAVARNHWKLPDPFGEVEDWLPAKPPKIEKKLRRKKQTLRFEVWKKIVDAMHPWFRPMIEFMILTGMIHSEISALKRCDITDDSIIIRRAIVRGKEKGQLKTYDRSREIPVTTAMKTILDIVLARTESEYVFANEDCSPYLREGFIKNYWKPAIEKAGVDYVCPYSMRHTFSMWSLLIGVEPVRLIDLMGHCDMEMIFRTYGSYIKHLRKDKQEIRAYMGADYATGEEE